MGSKKSVNAKKEHLTACETKREQESRDLSRRNGTRVLVSNFASEKKREKMGTNCRGEPGKKSRRVRKEGSRRKKSQD